MGFVMEPPEHQLSGISLGKGRTRGIRAGRDRWGGLERGMGHSSVGSVSRREAFAMKQVCVGRGLLKLV